MSPIHRSSLKPRACSHGSEGENGNIQRYKDTGGSRETVNLKRPEGKGRPHPRPRPCCGRVPSDSGGARSVAQASGGRWLLDLRPGPARWRFPEPQRPCSPAWETQPRHHPASPRRPARVRFPQRGTGTKPLHTHTMARLRTRRGLQSNPPRSGTHIWATRAGDRRAPISSAPGSGSVPKASS